MAKMQLKNINKIYDNGFQAVVDFNLDIDDHEFIVLVGPSGCGKSTMIRIIAGLEAITEGEMLLDGKLVNHDTPRERGVSMVFQSYALYPHLNVYENMAFALMLEGCDEDFIEKRVKETAEILGLSKYLDRKPRELSGGQCQRVAVGRAIIRNPQVFLMDEPLSNLDAKQRASMRTEIIEIHRKTKAITIYVTHDQVEAMTMADRIVVMKDGVVQQIGTPFEAYFRPSNAFVAGFIGEPPMNFFSAVARDGAIVLLSEGAEVATLNVKGSTLEDIINKMDGEELTLGFRPEAAITKGEGKSEEIVGKGDEEKDDRTDVTTEITAPVELTELLGDALNVYAKLGETSFIVRTSPKKVSTSAKTVKFWLPAKALYIFNKKTGAAIYER